MSNTVDNPFFARVWMFLSRHETEAIQRLRRENLAGLSGRVLEVGAGTGTNFALYPDTVTEVVAVEPERRLAALAQKAAADAPVPVTLTTDTVEQFSDA
jgi:protein-L-isoaspartate O-methyltransferase